MRRDCMRRGLLAASASWCLIVASAAQAQEGTQTSTEPGSAEDAEGQVIVVTAQKREEDVQDVPISITVVGGETIRQTGASQLSEYAAYIPGLQIENAGSPGRSTLSLRGVAPIGPSATVGLYLDDAPIGSSGIYNRSQVFTLDLMPYDIQRLEVLRGPQGTLYGASSIGGLLKYVTVQPDPSELKVHAGAEVFGIAHGEDLGWALSGLINVPIVADQLAISGSYSRRDTPGYIDNILTGEEDVNDVVQQGGRVALLWRPDPALTVSLSGVWQSVNSENLGIVYEGLGNTPLAPGAPFLSTNTQLPEPFTSDFQFYSGRIAYDFGFAELSSTTSYSELDILEASDATRVFGGAFGGFAPFPSRLRQKKWTEEVRLTSASSDRFEWMVGLFYTDEDNDHRQVVRALDAAGAPIPGLDPFALVGLPNTYQEYAIFGNATLKLSEMFHLTGGLRWARNEQTFTQSTSIPLLGLNASGSGASEEDIVTFSISPQVHLSPDAMLYARVASGYKPGGPNVALPGFPATVGAETVTSYEAGIKASILDRALSFDAAVFLLNWDNLQTSAAFAAGINGLVNAGTARSTGIEASLLARPVTGVSIGANFAYTAAKCTETTAACTDGDRLPSIPEISAALTADYSFPVGRAIEARLGGALRIIDDRVSEVESSPLAVPVPGYTTLDLNASITFSENWTLRAYVRNVTDEEGRVSSGISTPNPGFLGTAPLQPRTFGLALDLTF